MSENQFTESELASEEWREAPGFPGYRVSNLGRVMTSWRSGPNPVPFYCWRILSRRPEKSGHLHVEIKGKRHFVHKLALLAFVGPKPNGHECLHDDNNPANNRITNIRWGTKSENYADRVRSGKGNGGERHGMAKLKDADVVEMRSLYATGKWPSQRLGIKFGVSQSVALDAVRGVSFRHLPNAIPARPKATEQLSQK
jgi:hypothetical protein